MCSGEWDNTKKPKIYREMEDKIINKVLLLYLINNLENPVDMEKLQTLVFLCQKKMQEEGIRGFTYDWVWKEES